MKLKALMSVGLASLLMLNTTTTMASGDSPATVAGATTITVDKAKQLWLQGVVFLDARDSEEWEAGRVPGAYHFDVTLDSTNESNILDVVDKDQVLVTYCNSINCGKSGKLTKMMVSWGWTNIQYFRGGFAAWDQAELPYE